MFLLLVISDSRKLDSIVMTTIDSGEVSWSFALESAGQSRVALLATSLIRSLGLNANTTLARCASIMQIIHSEAKLNVYSFTLLSIWPQAESCKFQSLQVASMEVGHKLFVYLISLPLTAWRRRERERSTTTTNCESARFIVSRLHCVEAAAATFCSVARPKWTSND